MERVDLDALPRSCRRKRIEVIAPPVWPPVHLIKRKLLYFSRTVHIYLTMLGMFLMLLFGITGFTIDHEDWCRATTPRVTSSSSRRSLAGVVMVIFNHGFHECTRIKAEAVKLGTENTPTA